MTATRTERATVIVCACGRGLAIPDHTRIDEIDALYLSGGWFLRGAEPVCGRCARAGVANGNASPLRGESGATPDALACCAEHRTPRLVHCEWCVWGSGPCHEDCGVMREMWRGMPDEEAEE